jgi:tagatose 1,6-diphosphate aldolase
MLTLGKIRGLDALAGPEGTFSILALDHRGTFRRMIAGLFDGEPAWPDLVAEQERLATALIPEATAVLMDPLFTAGPLIARGAVPGGTGFLVSLERSGYEGGDGARRNVLEPGWSAEAIKRMGADGVKLLVQYHPDAPSARAQEDLVTEVAESCRRQDLVLVLEPVAYNPAGDKSDPGYRAALPDTVVEIARRLDQSGADVLKLDFPLVASDDEAEMVAACRRVTDATRLPWVVLSAGVDFATFLRQVQAACDGGASGFLGGRAIWQEVMEIRDGSERSAYLGRVARRRLAALRVIADTSATPWRDRLGGGLASPGDGWHKEYAARTS